MDPAVWGWLGLAAYVLFYDAWAVRSDRETLSGLFGRAIAHPAQRWPVTVLWVGTTLHLYGRLPRQFDPFGSIATALRRHH